MLDILEWIPRTLERNYQRWEINGSEWEIIPRDEVEWNYLLMKTQFLESLVIPQECVGDSFIILWVTFYLNLTKKNRQNVRYVFDTNPSTSVGIRTQAGQFMSQIKPLLKPLDWGEGTKVRQRTCLPTELHAFCLSSHCSYPTRPDSLSHHCDRAAAGNIAFSINWHSALIEIVKEAPSMHREVYNQIRYVFHTNPSTRVGIRTQADTSGWVEQELLLDDLDLVLHSP